MKHEVFPRISGDRKNGMVGCPSCHLEIGNVEATHRDFECLCSKKGPLSPSHIHPTPPLQCRNLANVMSVADAIRVRDRRTMAAREEIPRRCSRIPVAAKRPSHLRLVPNFVDNLDTTMASPRQIWVTLQTYMDVNIG